MKSTASLACQTKWHIQEHSQPGPSRILALHEEMAAHLLGKTLFPTILPTAKPLAQRDSQCMEAPLNDWAWFTGGSAKIKPNGVPCAAITSTSVPFKADMVAILSRQDSRLFLQLWPIVPLMNFFLLYWFWAVANGLGVQSAPLCGCEQWKSAAASSTIWIAHVETPSKGLFN